MTIRTYVDTIDTMFPDGFERETLFRTQGDMLSPSVGQKQGLFQRMAGMWGTWRMSRAGRLALRDLSDEHLRDIGLTRAEAEAEVRKSIFID